MIQKLLLNTQMIWMIFKEILKNAIQIKNEKYWLYLMIWLLMCLVNLTQSYFAVPKNTRLNSTHYFVMEILSKRKLQQIVFWLSRLYKSL